MADAAATFAIRVLDARTVGGGGPVHVVLSGDLPFVKLASAVGSGGGQTTLGKGRLELLAVPDRLVDAAGRVGGALLADPFRVALERAIEAWSGTVPDLLTRKGTLPLASRPVVMGIVNVTPDSFSDGGLHLSHDAAIAHGLALLAQGADIIDVGGESTRPGAQPVGLDDERDRVLPVVRALAEAGAVVSIDTSKAAVAAEALQAGACMVNDVTAGQFDDTILGVVARERVPYVAMHAQGAPSDMQDEPIYEDVAAEVFEYLGRVTDRCVMAGIDRAQVIVDPGLGFGKTVAHNLALLRSLRDLRSLGQPVLVGASRKSFLGAVTGVETPSDRLAGSIAAAVLAAEAGAAILRVHDVAHTVEALQVASAVRVGQPVEWEQPCRTA